MSDGCLRASAQQIKVVIAGPPKLTNFFQLPPPLDWLCFYGLVCRLQVSVPFFADLFFIG
jgi:hypothetical protein